MTIITTSTIDKPVRGSASNFDDRMRSSNFLITINPNFPAHTELESELGRQFQELINFIFDGDNILNYLTMIEEGEIKEIDIKIAYEVGSIQNRLHSHILVKIKHKAKIRINLDNLRDVCNEFIYGAVDVRTKSCYIHIRTVSDNILTITQYITK